MRRFGVLLAVIMLILPSGVVWADAPGAGVLVSELMTGTNTSASAEFVELHNQSNQDINISGWKLQYFSATGTSASTKVIFAGSLKAHGFLLAGTDEFKTEFNLSSLDFTFNSGFSDSGGRIKLVNENGDSADSISWGSTSTASEGAPASPLARSESLKRRVNTDAAFIDDGNNATDFTVSETPFPQGGDVYENVSGSPQAEPSDEGNVGSDVLVITELLANAIGSDTGNEFIEIYNPNNTTVALDGYVFMIGPNFETTVNLPVEIEILPNQYLALYNNHPSFTLVNTSSRVKLVAPAGDTVSETPAYNNPAEGQSWSVFGEAWQFTAKATPDSENQLISVAVSSDESSIEPEPCAPGKYRNPETNRCKTIEGSELSACDAGQERNPETNRCRKVNSSDLAPCKAGYERNPSTNRCRKAGTDEDLLTPCQPGYERNPETNRCRKVTAANSKLAAASQISAINPIQLSTRILLIVLVVALGYGAFEYRNDIRNIWDRFHSKNPSK